jgi:hypothetical protein
VIRTTMDQAWVKRNIRPLYGWTQTTPKAMLLDPAWDRSVDIYPGMCAMKTSGDQVSLINGTGYPYGLFGNFIGGYGIDRLLEQGVNACAVWPSSRSSPPPSTPRCRGWTRATAPRSACTPTPRPPSAANSAWRAPPARAPGRSRDSSGSTPRTRSSSAALSRRPDPAH